jgi:hypothetical protein
MKLLQETLELGLGEVFPNITIARRIFSVCLHQWLQVNALSMS